MNKRARQHQPSWRGTPARRRRPLAVCDAAARSPKRDFANVRFGGERKRPRCPKRPAAFNLAFNPEHRWYYYPHMQPDEVLAFEARSIRALPDWRMTAHTSFVDPSAVPELTQARELRDPDALRCSTPEALLRRHRSTHVLWDQSKPAHEQSGFQDHARFMGSLEAEGFIVLAGLMQESSDASCSSSTPRRGRGAQPPEPGPLAAGRPRPPHVRLEQIAIRTGASRPRPDPHTG